MDTRQNPKETYALVVGIEKYNNISESDWLDGPAKNAVDFAKWLLDKKVSKDNIGLFISPLEKNYNLIEKAGLIDINQEASSSKINNYIKTHIYNTKEEHDLLYVFWGSHGVTNTATEKLEQVLLYSDYSDELPEHLSLELLHTALKRPSLRQGFRRQIYIIDACRVYYDLKQYDETYRTYFKPKEQKNIKDQFILYATLQGDVAKNKQGTGIFSREVLKALNPYTLILDMNALANKVAYNLAKNNQKISINCTDWNGDQYSLSRIEKKEEKKQDWGESLAINENNFFGRKEELVEFEQLIVKDHCRLLIILGMGGIGKTALAKKLANKIQDDFNYVIWRSLREAPPVEKILTDVVKFLSNQQIIDLPDNLSDAINLIIQNYLKSSRCLLIFDNVESIMQAGESTGQYQKGYEGYRQLFNAIGEREHNSCLLLTSRERPQNFERLGIEDRFVRFRELSGLTFEDIQKFFSGILASKKELLEVLKLYSGNPLFLKLAANYVKYEKRFQGKIGQFLKEAKFVIGKPLLDCEDERDAIRKMLDWYFQRLSDDNQSDEKQKEVIYWFAINREPVSFSELKEDILSSAKNELLDTLQSLQRRIPLEIIENNKYTLQNLLIEYITDRLVEKIFNEIKTEKISLLNSHALTKAQTKDYVKENQKRLILKPIIDKVEDDSNYLIEDKLKKILENQELLKRYPARRKPQSSYAAGNILNFLIYLKLEKINPEIQFKNYNFSNLSVWQADLRNVDLYDVNFCYSNLDKTAFIENFGNIISVVFDSDGKLLFGGDACANIYQWQISGRKQNLKYTGHSRWIRSIAFNSEKKLLASGGGDETIRLWSINRSDCLEIKEAHKGGSWAVTFSSDGQILASGGGDKTVKIWDADTGQHRLSLKGHTKSIWSLAFSCNGQILASCGEDNTIRLWNIGTNESLEIPEAHEEGVWSVAFSPNDQNDRILASGGGDNIVKIWNVETCQVLSILKGHSDRIWSVAFSPSGKFLASGSRDRTIRIWNIETEKCLHTLTSHSNWVWSVAFSPDGQLLASGSDDQGIRLWDVDTGKCIYSFQGYSNWIWSLTFNPKSTILASSSDDCKIRLWDVDTGKELKALERHSDRIWSVAFNPDGQLLASGSGDRTIKLWDVDTSEELQTLEGHQGLVRSIAFSPDGQLLASGSGDRTIKLWNISNIKTPKCSKTLEGHQGLIRSIAFSPDGKFLASGSEDRTIRIWNIDTGKCLNILKDHSDWIWSLTFSPNGKLLASGGGDRTIKLWDVENLPESKLLDTLTQHTDQVWSLAFSNDSKILISGSEDQTIKLWNIENCANFELLESLNEEPYFICSVAISSTGIFAIGSTEGIVKLWNVDTCDQILSLISQKPYHGMNIKGVRGLTDEQIRSLKTLGAIEK